MQCLYNKMKWDNEVGIMTQHQSILHELFKHKHCDSVIVSVRTGYKAADR